MAINLHVNDYCQNCRKFEAYVVKEEHIDVFGNYIGIDTHIYCEHKDTCELLLKHLRDEADYAERTKTIVDLYNEEQE